ncbi:hypothetical protein, partial [Lentzea flava]|uniref:hypothetical protein n=1 Tax=Lentzea flava TaxID=103732 RepID=UPI001E4C9B26
MTIISPAHTKPARHLTNAPTAQTIGPVNQQAVQIRGHRIGFSTWKRDRVTLVLQNDQITPLS